MKLNGLSRAVIESSLMLAAAALGVVAVPRNKLADTRAGFDLETQIPMTFADWTVDPAVVPIPPSPDHEAALQQIYDQVLSRTYVNRRGERVMLTITYGSSQTEQGQVHRQEVCYASQGFEVSQLRREPITLNEAQISATRMVASRYRRIEPVTYWITMGDKVAVTDLERELAQFKYALSGHIPDGYLVRISSLSADPDSAFQRHIEFADLLLANVAGELRRRLTGHG